MSTGGVVIVSCMFMTFLIAMGGMLLYTSNRLSSIVGDPIAFMLKRGWVQCVGCDCLVHRDWAIMVDDFGGSGSGYVCPSCIVGGQNTQLLFMILGDGERYDRVTDLMVRGELTQGMLELEVTAQLVPGYAPDRER